MEENRRRNEAPSGMEGARRATGVPEGGERPPAGLSGEEYWEEVRDEDQTVGWLRLPRLSGGRKNRSLKSQKQQRTTRLTPAQRLLILDTWQRSGLPAKDFAGIVGIASHTLYSWKRKFDDQGPEGLFFTKGGSKPRSSRLPEVTKRTILMIKESNPDFGCRRISAMLERGPGLAASANAVARVLKEAGYQSEDQPTKPHPDKKRRFERKEVNTLWQTDLFSFVLKRQNRRVHLVIYMDDHSRYIVSHGLHLSASGELVIEVLRSGIASYGPPQELLTDNGSQYKPWRGKGDFTRECEKQGIKQIVSRPRHPQTLGKVERFWSTLWKEMLEEAIFVDLGEARERIGLFIDYYNFQRPHQGIDNLVPADRYFGAAQEIQETLQARVAANSLSLAKNGIPQEEFYLTGQVGGKPVSVRAEDGRLIIHGEQVEHEEPAKPGTSPLDEGLKKIRESFNTHYNEKERSHDRETETTEITDRAGTDHSTITGGTGHGAGNTRADEQECAGAGSDRPGSTGRDTDPDRSSTASGDQSTGILQSGEQGITGPGESMREQTQRPGRELPQTDPGVGRSEPEAGAGSTEIPEPDPSSTESDRRDAAGGVPAESPGQPQQQSSEETEPEESTGPESSRPFTGQDTHEQSQKQDHEKPAESRRVEK